MSKNVLDLTNEEAKKFFLAEERYFTFDLPQYFSFGELIKKLSEKLEGKNLEDFYSEYKVTNQKGTEETKKQNPTSPT